MVHPSGIFKEIERCGFKIDFQICGIHGFKIIILNFNFHIPLVV
jgi:hypothetical protein